MFDSSQKRTYPSSVRVGMWNEELAREEYEMKQFLKKQNEGQLTVQKIQRMLDIYLKPTHLSDCVHGKVMYGDTVQMCNHFPMVDKSKNCLVTRDMVLSACLSPHDLNATQDINTACFFTASYSTESVMRNSFLIEKCDDPCSTDYVVYGDNFYLKFNTVDEPKMYLESRSPTLPSDTSPLSSHQLLSLSCTPTRFSRWQAVFMRRDLRLEMDGQPVEVNQEFLLNHVMSNRNLFLGYDHMIPTYFGKEYECTTYSIKDNFCKPDKANRWFFKGRPLTGAANPVYPPDIPSCGIKDDSNYPDAAKFHDDPCPQPRAPCDPPQEPCGVALPKEFVGGPSHPTPAESINAKPPKGCSLSANFS